MKEQELNAQYIILQQNNEPYKNNYTNFDPMQYYSHNYSYFSHHPLFYNCNPWQYSNLYQPCMGSFTNLPTTDHYNQTISAPSKPSLLSTGNPENKMLNLRNTQADYMSQSESPDAQDKIPDMKITRTKMKKELNKDRPFKKGGKSFTSYYWSPDENRRYVEFLKLHPGLFDLSVCEKKNLKVNVMMSKKIKTRSPQQCHSHHQKMLKKFGSHEGVIEGLICQRSKIIGGRKQEGDQVKDQVKVEENIVDQ